MSRYYKPNNSTILYLNSSYNCVKSNTITITKTTAGSGYTSTPSIVVVPATGDMGVGATANAAYSAGGIASITMLKVMVMVLYQLLKLLEVETLEL